MQIIGETPAPKAEGKCNGADLTGLARSVHDGGGALVQILMVLVDAAHAGGEDITLQALMAIHDVCDAVTVGWMMQRAQMETESVSVRLAT